MAEKIYTGFYLFPNYIINEKLIEYINEFRLFKRNNPHLPNKSLLRKIANEKRKIIFRRKYKNHEFIISGDGLIQYRDSILEDNIMNNNIEVSNNITTPSYARQYWNEYIKKCNIFYFLIDCASHNTNRNSYIYEFSELTKNNSFIRIKYINNKISTSTDYTRNSLFNFANTNIGDFISNLIYESININTLDIFIDMWNLYKKIIKNEKLFEDINVIQKSLNQHNLESYNSSFLLAWIIIEQYIFENWKILLSKRRRIYYLDEHGDKKILTGRQLRKLRANIRRNRSPLAGKMLINLKTSNYSKISDYITLNELKDIRNNIIHGGHICLYSENRKILEHLKIITNEKYKIDIDYNTLGHSTISL